MSFHRLTTSGPALAAFLEEAATVRGPFDGLLIGKVRLRTESRLHDNADETRREFLEAHISAFCCSNGLGSFYNPAGHCETDEVLGLTQACDGDFLGWFTHQHGPPRLPTIRERTVTAAMAQLVPPDIPVLFASMNSTLHPDRATAGFGLQFLQQEPGTVVLIPVELCVENIGSQKRTRDYRPLRPVTGLPAIALAHVQQILHHTGERPRSAGSRAVESACAQTYELETIFSEMLADLDSLSEGYAKEQSDLRTLQCEIDALSVSVGL